MATTNKIEKGELQQVLDKTLDWSRKTGYKGYNKHDGLNSPVLNLLLGWSKWPRLVAIQGIMRFPVNLRPLFFTPQTYNPKGLALFTMALLDQFRVSQDPSQLQEAETLLSLLKKLKSPGDWNGICWGYHYPWQDAGFFAPKNTPNAVVTSFVCEAFLEAFRVTKKQEYLDTVSSAINFFLKDLKILKDTPQELCLSYMPVKMSVRVMDVSILIGAVLAQHATLSHSNKFETAERLVRYVVNCQTAYHAWWYTDPPSDSHISHDNYHTGFILDALDRYMKATGDTQWQDQYDAGLKFYAEHLFNDDGSPRWMHDKDYPHDIHGAAQGILTFSRHLDTHQHLVKKITDWTLKRMYEDGRFYYQETAFYRKKFTLLRWCNGWMSRAISFNLRCSSKLPV